MITCPLNNWDVSNVKDVGGMFEGAKLFNQDLDKWDLSNINEIENMFILAENFKSKLPKFKNHTATKGLLRKLGLPLNF